MFSSLRYRLMFGFFFIILLFASGVMLTLFVVSRLGDRTELLVNRHWKSNILIGKTHDLLGEVAIFISRAPYDQNSANKSRELQLGIDKLVDEIDDSAFREDFRREHGMLLLKLRDNLSGPIELLRHIEEENRKADAALESLLHAFIQQKRSDLGHNLNIAALAYRDFAITANPSDLEIFRQQLLQISRDLPESQAPAFTAFSLHGKKVFERRLLLRQSRDEILSQTADIARNLRSSSEHYLNRVVQPAGIEVISGLSSISTILLIAVVGGGVASLAVSILLARRFSSPMEQAVVVLSRIEGGDFSLHFTSDGDAESERLGQAINSLAESLHKALRDQEETMQSLIASKTRFRVIAEERQELERILNASPTLVFSVRLVGEGDEIVAFISQNIRQLGYLPEEFVSGERSLASIIHPDDSQRVADIFAAHLHDQHSQSFSVDLRLLDVPGVARLMEGRILVQRDESGVACSYQGVLVDEPEKQRIREQVEKINNLAALGELAAGVAHEINNPNATILLNIALLKDMGEGSLRLLDEYFQTRGDFTVGRLPYTRVRDELPRLHAEIRDAAERIRRIVEDMKDFTRISPDQSRQLLSINEIAEAAIRLTHNIVKNSTNHFQVDFASDLPLVNVNRQQLEQVIVNLLINASQSLTSRSEAITLQTFLGAKGAVGLVVTDQGCGISPEHLPHVTDPFFTTRRERGGTGLGLSISARIIHDHRGQLIIESLGRGTTVKITIPATHGENLT